MINTIPNTIGMKRNVTPIFTPNFKPVLIFESNWMQNLIQALECTRSSTVVEQKSTYVELLWKLARALLPKLVVYNLVTDRSSVLLFCPNRTEQVN